MGRHNRRNREKNKFKASPSGFQRETYHEKTDYERHKPNGVIGTNNAYLDQEHARANAAALRELDKGTQARLGTNYQSKEEKRGTVFSSGLSVIEKPVIHIPIEINDICDEIQEKVGRNEFSILCKGNWDADGYNIGTEFVIPRQEVTSASVDYEAEHIGELKAQGFNAVIHSHPHKTTPFSSSDRETINANFVCSILYGEGEFVSGVINIDIAEEAILSISTDKIDVYRNITLPEINIGNIVTREVDTRPANRDYGRRVAPLSNTPGLPNYASGYDVEDGTTCVASATSMSDEQVEAANADGWESSINIDKWNSFKNREQTRNDIADMNGPYYPL